MSDSIAAGRPPNAGSVRILIADDNAEDVDFEVRAIEASGLAFQHLVVTTEDAYRSALGTFSPDVILSAYALATFDGSTALRVAHELNPTTPVIFLSKSLTEESTVIAIRDGAADFVLKTNLKRLPDAVVSAVERASEHKQRLAAEERIRQLSRTKDVLASANAAIVRCHDKGEIFSEICRIATERGGFAHSFIFTVQPGTKNVEIQALTGRDLTTAEGDARLAALQRTVKDLANAPGFVAESLRTGSPQTLKLSDHPEMRREGFLLSEGVEAVASFPIRLDEKVGGAIVFEALEAGHFDQAEMDLLGDLANNLSFALDLIEKQRRVDFLSYYDPLTNLANRTLFIDRLRNTLSTNHDGEAIAVMEAEVYDFATLHASLGERVGDEILKTCAARLSESFGRDRVARFPGDRFAICMPSLTTLEPVVDLFDERGLKIFGEPFAVDDRKIAVSVRTGCAMFPQDGADAETIVHGAEVALQNARFSGAPYRFYSQTQSDRLDERVALEQRLRQAIECDEFRLYYQPKVELATNTIAGLEALLRWPDRRGDDFIAEPAQFVPILEETGLIIDVGRWALEEAARQYARWRSSGLKAPRIAVNFSARQMQDANTVSQVRDATRLCGEVCGIDLEITESMLMENVESAASRLREMRSLGIEISLDDFGTGYSSLAVLQTLPISSIKIDRSFVNGMTEDVTKTSMISAIIALARSLGFKTIAEGVEIEEEAHLLRLLRCDQMQGYLFSHPVPPDAIAAMLAPI